MNAGKWSILILLLVLMITVRADSSPRAPSRSALAQNKLPEFVADPPREPNEDVRAPQQKLVFQGNFEAMVEILKHEPALVRAEMTRRLKAPDPYSLQLLAAAVLVFQNDDQGREFFRSHAKVIDKDLADLYVTLSEIEISAQFATPAVTDLSWAEDLMIEAIQNRTQLNLSEVSPLNSIEQHIEVRELAMSLGRFPEILAKMHSERALTVIIAMIRESRPRELDLKYAVASLGKYKDKRVEPVLLGILGQREDGEWRHTYQIALGAAVEAGLKSVLPILLKRLNDPDSYEGIIALADKNAIPSIERALPRLKDEARSEAELALIHLRGGDVVPPLLSLLRRKEFTEVLKAWLWLEKLKDPRAVPVATTALCHDPDWFTRWEAMRVLGAVGTDEAIAGLVNGLGCDYSRLRRGKVSSDHDYNQEYRTQIATTLKELTGNDFGIDQKKWREWLAR